jgi:hypothetical protein
MRRVLARCKKVYSRNEESFCLTRERESMYYQTQEAAREQDRNGTRSQGERRERGAKPPLNYTAPAPARPRGRSSPKFLFGDG